MQIMIDGRGQPGEDEARSSLAEVLVEALAGYGIRFGFGVTGGPIARFVHTLEDSKHLKWITARTEGGAVYEALGAWAVTGDPGLVVTTCGPGLFATRQALEVAKREGFRGVVVSPRTPARARGSHAAQGSETFVSPDYLLPGALFDRVVALESVDELAPLAAHLAAGLSGREGFLAHVMVPSDLLVKKTARPRTARPRPGSLVPNPRVVAEVVALLAAHRFFVVVGRGARADADLVRAFVGHTGAPVVCTPGAKGVVDERSGSAWGVTGIGGLPEAVRRLRAYGPELALVLGSRLSDASVTPELMGLPPLGLIQVDRVASAMGAAWDVPTLAVHSDLRPFLEALLAQGEALVSRPHLPDVRSIPELRLSRPGPAGGVSPRAVMAAVQDLVVDATSAPVFVEVGTAWPWVASSLSFSQPRRLFLETAVGSMGAANGYAIGAAVALGDKTVVITGDWALDMQLAEIRTAVNHDAPVVWIVLNNSGGQMVLDGDREVWGRTSGSSRFRPGDYAAAALGFGARAARVTDAADLCECLAEAMASASPYLLDVCTGLEEPPYMDRFEALRRARDGGDDRP